MTRLRGEGLGTGMALGTAVIVQMRDGLPALPDPPERVLRDSALRRGGERPDVVLVAEDYRTALALSGALPWARVVAIAASGAGAGSTIPAFPAVIQVGRLMDLAQNDLLMLVDADRGVVFVDPNPMALAQYTAEKAHLAPRHRLYLDEEHQPAITGDGVTIQIVARVALWEDMPVALGQGADALYLPYESGMLDRSAEPSAIQDDLLRIVEAAAGKPLFISDRLELPMTAVVTAAARAEITLAIPPQTHLDGLGFAELGAELRAAETECYEDDKMAAVPRLAADLRDASSWREDENEAPNMVEKCAAGGAARLLVGLEGDALSEGTLIALDPLLAAAHANLLPATVSASPFAFNSFGQNDLPNSLETAIRLLIGLGAAGAIVGADEVEEAKQTVRRQNAGDCRALLRSVLEATGA